MPSSLISLEKLVFRYALMYLNHRFDLIREPSGILVYHPESADILSAGREHICFAEGNELFLALSVSIESKGEKPPVACVLVLHLNCQSLRDRYDDTKLRIDLNNPDMCYLYHKELSQHGGLVRLRLGGTAGETRFSYTDARLVDDPFAKRIVLLLAGLSVSPLALL